MCKSAFFTAISIFTSFPKRFLAFMIGVGFLFPAKGLAFESSVPALEYDMSIGKFMEQIEGRYAHFDVVAYEQKIPFGKMESLIVTYGFTDFWIQNNQLMSQETFCHAEQRSNLPFQSDIPDAFTRNIKPDAVEVIIEKNDGEFKITRPETPTPIGLELDDWVNDPFPTRIDDQRFIDADDDGNLGVTVKIKILGLIQGELYIARREIFEYHLTWQDNGNFFGFVKDSSEQIAIGSKPEFLMPPKGPVIQNGNMKKSPIVLTPIDKSLSCDSLMEQRTKIFPRIPKI